MSMFGDDLEVEAVDIVKEIDEVLAKADRVNMMRGLTVFEMELQAKLMSCRFEIVVLRDRIANTPGA